jgi:universal stress protein A
MQIRKILVPVDFSHAEASALELAESLAKQHGGQLLIAHVQDSPWGYKGDMYYGVAEPDSSEVKEMLHQIKPTDATLRVDYRLLTGDPTGEIVRLADDEQVDLIVVSSHGRTGLSRMVMGSVAESIVRHAHCPVVVFKQRGKLNV